MSAGLTPRGFSIAVLCLLAVVVLASAPASARVIKAKMDCGWGARTADDEASPMVSLATGTYKISSTAQGRCACGGGGFRFDADAWPQFAPANKTTITVRDWWPAVPGSDAAPASGTGADFAASCAKTPCNDAQGYSYGATFLDQTLINEYYFKTHAYADATAFVNDVGNGDARIQDPTIMTWVDSEPHTLFHELVLLASSDLWVEVESPEEASAGAEAVAGIDFDLDGMPDQLFFSVRLGWDSGIRTGDVVLGPDVELDGATESQIEAALAACWMDATHMYVTNHIVMKFTYAVNTGDDPGPGSIGVTFDVSGVAEAGESSPTDAQETSWGHLKSLWRSGEEVGE